MFKRCLALAVLSLVVGALPTAACKGRGYRQCNGLAITNSPDKVDLRWRFDKSKTFYQELVTETIQEMKVMNMDVKQRQKQTFYFSWTAKDRQDNCWTFKQKIDGVKMDLEIGASKISYDSTAKGPGNNPLAAFFNGLVGSEFTVTVCPVPRVEDLACGKPGAIQQILPQLKVARIEGGAKLRKNLGAANPQMQQQLDAILNDDAMKQLAEPLFTALPNQGVRVGDTWKSTTRLNLGPIGGYDTIHEYKYEGKDEKGLDKISVKTALTYVPPPPGFAGGGLPFKIAKANLKSTGAGVVRFDSQAGRIASSETNLILEGTLEIEIGGQKTTVELKQTQKTTTKTSNDPFIKK